MLQPDWIIAYLRYDWCYTGSVNSLRFAQGLAIGGQWGGAMLLVTESAPSNQRGFAEHMPAGVPIGVILANLAYIIIGSWFQMKHFIHGVGVYHF